MKKRIIAVDDEWGFAHLLKRLLPEYSVQVETDCNAAFESALYSPPDLFLVDLNVPGMTGKRMAARMAQYECLRKIPIIFLSALVHSPEEDGEPVAIYGRPAFGKPFDVGILKRHIAENVSRRSKETATRLKQGYLVGE